MGIISQPAQFCAATVFIICFTARSYSLLQFFRIGSSERGTSPFYARLGLPWPIAFLSISNLTNFHRTGQNVRLTTVLSGMQENQKSPCERFSLKIDILYYYAVSRSKLAPGMTCMSSSVRRTPVHVTRACMHAWVL